MFKNKEFIMYKSKIGSCLLNECKMTVKEHLYCRIFVWRSIPRDIKILFKDLVNNFKELIISIINVLLLPYFIILMPFESYKTIQEAKQSVFDDYCYKCKFYKYKSKECSSCSLVNGIAINYIKITKEDIIRERNLAQ